jgi:mono/diheme cytochrome c family protein
MRRIVLGAMVLLVLGIDSGRAQGDDPVARGEYLFRAANCQSCHTDVKNKGELLAGGRALGATTTSSPPCATGGRPTAAITIRRFPIPPTPR